VDDTATVEEWRFWGPDQLYESLADPISDEQAATAETDGAVALPAPPTWDLRVAWYSAPCQTAPTVRVAGDSGRIARVVVEHGPQVLEGAEECPASLVLQAVDIRASSAPSSDVTISGQA
jgi:hypothetical protein